MIRLTDTELASVLQQAQEETRRRAAGLRKPNWRDLGAVIKGQEMAKRATLIAAAGNHSLLCVGPPGCGKTMLRALSAALGNCETFEAHPCPCGYYTDPRRSCECEAEEVAVYRRQWPKADMFIDVPPVPARELESEWCGTTELTLKAQMDNMVSAGQMADDHALSILRHAVGEMGLPARQYGTMLRIAETIARVEGAKAIEAHHMMEAINYCYPI